MNHKHHTKISHGDEKKDDGLDSKSVKYMLIAVVSVILILAAIFVASKYLIKDKNTIVYNNYTFTKFEGNKWMTQQYIRGEVLMIPFYYNPTEVDDIQVDPKAITALRQFSYNPNGTLYISVDPNESSKIVIAGVEYARILGKAYNIYNIEVKSGVSKVFDIPTAQSGIPIITCSDDASKDVFVIYQKVSNKNLVSVPAPNCILIESRSVNESIRVADAFSFRLLNIMKE